MSQAKAEALDLIRRMPDTATTADIYSKEQVDCGLRDAMEDRAISHQELKERLARWRRSPNAV